MSADTPAPKTSLVVIVHDMAREAPRTLHTLSAGYQRGVTARDYEIIVVDNGSSPPFDPRAMAALDGDFTLIRIDESAPSPVEAINRGIAAARGDLVGVLIDGARMASPGLVATALMADRIADRAVILTPGFHLGPEVQMTSVRNGYDQAAEDLLLAQAGWIEDGYRLFDISVFAGSSSGGWFRPMAESCAIFMRRDLWRELGGYDRKFQAPGGGLANLDTLSRAVALDGATIVTLLGEGTFHQIHGGVATNAIEHPWDSFAAEYLAIRGHAYRPPEYRSLYFGAAPVNALGSIERAAQK